MNAAQVGTPVVAGVDGSDLERARGAGKPAPPTPENRPPAAAQYV